mgnify:CR=1 FL=1
MAETFTLYKLIVLYMLDRVDFPLTTSQISEFILDKGYTTYFRLQSALAELTDSGLLKIELTHNRTLYNLTEEGLLRSTISEIKFLLRFVRKLIILSMRKNMI